MESDERNEMADQQALINSTIGVFTNDAMENAKSLALKDEGTNGANEVIGPMWLSSDEDGYRVLENDAKGGWVTAAYAETLADALGLPFQIV